MRFNRLNVISATVLMTVAASSAFAFEATLGTVISPVVTIVRLADTTVFGPTATSIQLSSGQVAAILDAQMDSVDVLKGKSATDAFAKGKEALEEAAGVVFKSDKEAARAILEVSGAIEAQQAG